MRTTYRLLRDVKSGALAPLLPAGGHAEDEVVCYHCEVGLGILDEILRGGMLEHTQQRPQLRIRVLS